MGAPRVTLAFVAITLAIKDIQSNAALDEHARSRWIVGMASAFPLTAIACLVVCSRHAAQDGPSVGSRKTN